MFYNQNIFFNSILVTTMEEDILPHGAYIKTIMAAVLMHFLLRFHFLNLMIRKMK